jgi:hypothetical protein
LSPEDAKMAADDLVNRNLGPTIAAELAAFNVFAGSTGDIWAGQFYQEGVDGATAQVNAIKATLESRLSDLYQEGKKMGKAVKNGYESVIDSLPAAANGSGRRGDLQGSNGPVTIHVNAPIGDPVAIARAIKSTLRVADQRVGR